MESPSAFPAQWSAIYECLPLQRLRHHKKFYRGQDFVSILSTCTKLSVLLDSASPPTDYGPSFGCPSSQPGPPTRLDLLHRCGTVNRDRPAFLDYGADGLVDISMCFYSSLFGTAMDDFCFLAVSAFSFMRHTDGISNRECYVNHQARRYKMGVQMGTCNSAKMEHGKRRARACSSCI